MQTKGNVKGVSTKGVVPGRELFLLDVMVNLQKLRNLVLAERLSDRGLLLLPLEAWHEARLRPAGEQFKMSDGTEAYALDSVLLLSYVLDRPNQALTVTAPAAAFEISTIGGGRGGAVAPNDSPPGLYINYDLIAANSGGSKSFGGLVDAVLFNRWGSLVSGAAIRSAGDRSAQWDVIRTETNWRKDLPGDMETLVLGDTVASGAAWSRPARYAGIRWARDFSLRPGYIFNPMPSLNGSAALPATVDLLINNQRVQRSQIPSGPFELSNVPLYNGAGEINLVVRDLLGRETVVTQNYYSSHHLLATGLTDFSYEAGYLRQGFGSANDSYGPFFAAGTFRYGLSNVLTAGARLEAQKERKAAGVELTALLGSFGVARSAVAMSQQQDVLGRRYLFGFERNASAWSGAFQWEGFDSNFTQFAGAANEARPRQRFSAGFSTSVFQGASAGIHYISQSTWDGDDFSLASISLGVLLPWRMSLTLSASKLLDAHGSWSGGLNLYIPLSAKISASMRSVRSREPANGVVNTLEVHKSMPSGPGTAWYLRASNDLAQRAQAGLSLSTNVGRLTADANTSISGQSLRLGTSGSLGWLEGLSFASRQIGQGSFAVVKVGDVKDLPVYRSNQFVATTNGKGMALVPDLLPYESNLITIVAEEVALDVEVKGIRQETVPYARSGVLVEFDVHRSRNALVILRQPDGQPVPAGARVTLLASELFYFVGKRGEVYLTGLNDANHLTVKWKTGSCVIDMQLDPNGPVEPRIGPLNCGGPQ